MPGNQVPQGHVWVVGDNLPYSRDSRHFGPLPKALIKGKVIARVLPLSDRKWIVNEFQPVEGNRGASSSLQGVWCSAE
jgi:inner membrane protease subunit 1